jgi:hypothetical protein
MREPEQAEPDPSAPIPRFSFVRRADGSLLVSYGAAPITVVRGRAAEQLSAAGAELAQQLMARAARTRRQRRSGGDTGS